MTPNEIQKILDNGIYYVCKCGVIFPSFSVDNSKEISCKCEDIREQFLTSVKVADPALSKYLFELLVESLKQTDEALAYAESYRLFAEGS